MKIKTGCDLVQISKFKKAVQKGGQTFLKNLYSAHELASNEKLESLAGLFAAKEAIMKALGLEPGCWKEIEIVKNFKGKPEAIVSCFDGEIISQDISISHDGDYAMAVGNFLVK